MTYVCDCSQITIAKWNELMEDATPTDGVVLREKIRVELPHLYEDLALNFFNPYEEQCVETDTHYVYVWSAIEFFILKDK